MHISLGARSLFDIYILIYTGRLYLAYCNYRILIDSAVDCSPDDRDRDEYGGGMVEGEVAVDGRADQRRVKNHDFLYITVV